MSVHTIHPDSHTNGLADGCDRCMEHAERPFEALDEVNLTLLIQRIWEKADGRSMTERVAMDNIRHHLLIADRIGRLTREMMAAQTDG